MINWIEILSIDAEALKKYAEQFNIHPYILSDCVKKDLRPKIMKHISIWCGLCIYRVKCMKCSL